MKNRLIQFVGISAALAAFGSRSLAFHDKENEFTAITKSLDTAIEAQKSQAKKLADVEAALSLDGQRSKILGDVQGDVKKALEELEKTRKDHYTLEERMHALQKAHRVLEMERRASFGNPIQAITHNEEKSLRFLATVCKLVHVPLSTSVAKRMADLEIKIIGEDSSPGSNYINNELRNDIYSTLMTYGVFNKFKVIRTNTKETSLPLTTARPVASWVTTEGTGPSADSTKAGSLGSLTMGELIANIPVSLRLIEDADIDIVGDLINDLGEAFAYAIDNTLFNAETTNNATYGGFNGIVNQAGVTTAASGNVSVQTLDYDDFVDAYAALDSGVIQRGVAEWFMNPVLLAVSAKIKDSTGRPIFGTALDVPNAKTIANIIGLPANPVGVLASTNTTSTKVAFVGDPMGAAVGIRKDLAIESSDHSGWVNATRDFRGRLRAGVLVRKAGAFRALRTAAP